MTVNTGISFASGITESLTFSGGTFNNSTFTGVSSFANGSSTAPSITGATVTTGLYFSATQTIVVPSSGNYPFRVQTASTIAGIQFQNSNNANGFFEYATTSFNTYTNNVLATVLSSTKLNIAAATATPAGGTTGAGLQLGTTSNLGLFFGSGLPTLSAAQGSLYIRTDGSGIADRLYVNTNGTTGWTNFVSAT